MHGTIVVRVCDSATFGVDDMTIDCAERRIFSDNETVGGAHYSHGIIADSMYYMG